MIKIIKRTEKLELQDFKNFKEVHFTDAKGTYWFFCKDNRKLILYYFQEYEWHQYQNLSSSKKNYEALCSLIEDLFTNQKYQLKEISQQ